MVSKLLDENKQPLSEKRYFKSFQTSPVPPRTEMRQKDVAGFTSAMVQKELEWQTEEISAFHEYKLLKHQQVPCLEDISNLKVCLQELARRLGEKEKDLIKEKSEILEERGLVIQQDKILEDMQIKISQLEEQLKHPEVIRLKISKQLRNRIEALGAESSQQGEKVDNCPSTPAQKIDMVKPTQKSMIVYLKKICFYLGNSLWLFGRFLLRSGCSCITMVLFYKHLSDATWICRLLNRISYRYYESWLWPH